MITTFECKRHLHGVLGDFSGSRPFDENNYESTDNLINDVMKMLKERDACVTFGAERSEAFNYEMGSAFSRIYRFANDSYSVVYWERENDYSNHDGCKLTRKLVKDALLFAIKKNNEKHNQQG